LVAFVIINQWQLSTLTLFGFTIPRLLLFRSSELSIKDLGQNFLTIFHDSFFNDWLDYNAFPFYGPLYPISLPLGVLGLITGSKAFFRQFRRRRLSTGGLVWLFFVIVWIVSLFILGPNINKINGLYFGWVFWLVWALVWIWKRKRILVVIILIIYLGHFVSFTQYYFNVYPKDIYPQHLFAQDFAKGWIYLNKNFPHQKIYFEDRYIYYLLGNLCPPKTNNMYELMMTDKRGRYQFHLPSSSLNPAAIFVIRETNDYFKFRLELNNFQLKKTIGMYQIWEKKPGFSGLELNDPQPNQPIEVYPVWEKKPSYSIH